MKQSPSFLKAFSAMKKARNILLTTHENPDGDALSSVCAVYEWLKASKSNIFLFCKDAPDKSFNFIPNIERLTSEKQVIDFKSLEAVLILDCATLKRTGLEAELRPLQCPIINIDHHASNGSFGTLNIIDSEAVSTTQILYDFFKAQSVEINKNMAHCILTGIVTDSGNFAYAASKSETFDVAGEMLIRGANVRDIINYTNKNKRLPTLKIWGLALSRLSYNRRHDIAYTVLTQKDLKNFGVSREDLEGLSNFLNTLKDAKIVMVLYELEDGRVKGSFRTTYDDVDVAKLALRLGGGGHQKAAGFEVEGKLEQTKSGWKII